MKKWGYFFGLSLVMALPLAACSDEESSNADGEDSGDSSGEKTEITLWHMEEPPNRVEGFNAVIDAFNEQSDSVEVNAQVQSWGDAYSQFPAAIQSGTGPDLLFTIPDYTALLQDLDVVQPVDDMFEELNSEHSFIEASVAPYSYDDQIWAVPIFGMVQALWYREDIFAEAGLEAPETWDELLETAEALTTDGRHGIALPASRSMATDQVLYSFMISGGASNLIDGENNVTFNTPEAVNTFEFYSNLLEYSPNDSNTYQWGEPQAQFNSGNAAMAIEKGQYLLPFESESGRPPSDLGVVPMPTNEDGEEGSIYYSNGIMVLTDDQAKQDAIMEFFEFLYAEENYANFINAEPGLFLPVTETGMNSDAYWNNETISTYEEQVQVLLDISEQGKLFGFTDGVASEIGQIAGPNYLAQTLEKIIIDGMSPEEAVEWGQQQMEQAVQ